MKKKVTEKLREISLRFYSRRGNFFSEHALGIVITVVIGVILFAAVNLIFKDLVIPGIKEKISNIFLGDK